MLKNIAERNNVLFFNFNDFISEEEDKPVFTSLVHLSHQGTKLIAKHLYELILKESSLN